MHKADYDVEHYASEVNRRKTNALQSNVHKI